MCVLEIRSASERRRPYYRNRSLANSKNTEGIDTVRIASGFVSQPDRMLRTSTHDHERNNTQGPSADRAPFFELLFAGLVNWVLASSSLVGELLVLLAKLEFSWL